MQKVINFVANSSNYQIAGPVPFPFPVSRFPCTVLDILDPLDVDAGIGTGQVICVLGTRATFGKAFAALFLRLMSSYFAARICGLVSTSQATSIGHFFDCVPRAM